jgi:polyphenol oxidase
MEGYKAAVNHMKMSYQSKPEELLVCISPSLGPESAEFVNYRTELPEPFWEFQSSPLHFDLWSIAENQLIEAGVLPYHIQIARIDTFANGEDYFSYRRSNKCGRQATVCSLIKR